MTPPERSRHEEFAQLLGVHHARLLAFIRSLVLDPNDAYDVFQETAIAIWRQFDQYDSNRSFGSWANGIAYHKAIDLLRTRGRNRTGFSDEFIEKMASLRADAPDSPEFLWARKAALKGCIDSLPEPQRSLVNRCYSGAETVKDVATSLERTTHSIYSSLRHVRGKLLKCIEAKLGQTGGRAGG
jgi:RNA polymerase sigma-70 factor (ECF subfamily)